MKKRTNPKSDAMRDRSLMVESERQNSHTTKYSLNEQIENDIDKVKSRLYNLETSLDDTLDNEKLKQEVGELKVTINELPKSHESDDLRKRLQTLLNKLSEVK